MDTAIWWVGVLHLAGYGVLGMVLLADKLLDYLVKSFGVYRDLMAFVYHRLKERAAASPQPSDEP